MERVTYNEPAWVCLECAAFRGASPPVDHCYTVHRDICGICNEECSVTEPRDMGVTRALTSNNYAYILSQIHSWRRRVTSDVLEKWINHTALYSKKHWLILIAERLYRTEKEIYI